VAECVILIGLPGAGKSTFYRRTLAPTHLHISKDLIPRGAKDKQARQEALIRTALASGRSIAVDNTHVTTAERGEVIRLAREYGARVVGCYIEATTREAIARNERREGREQVPEVAIFTRAKHLEPPRADEGFDELQTYRVNAEGQFERTA
jgi:predicted kinase